MNHADPPNNSYFSGIFLPFIIPEHYNGSWGDYSQIQMVNALIKNAVNSGDFDYYSLHSGVDLCVREVSEFADYLSKNNLYGFYECTKLPSTWRDCQG